MVIRSIPDIDCGAIQKLCYDPLDKGIKVYILRSKIRKKTFFTDCLFRIDCKKVVTYLVFDMLCIGFLKTAEGFRIRFDKFRNLFLRHHCLFCLFSEYILQVKHISSSVFLHNMSKYRSFLFMRKFLHFIRN